MNKQDLLLAQSEFLFPAVFHYYREPLVIARARNQFVWDADGNQYLDFFGGIVTVSVGHCNDAVNQRIHQQVDTLQHVSTLFVTEPQVALAQKIGSMTPGGGALRKSFFTNSGTEANEVAILTARCYTGSTEIVALRHSYHGRSALGMTLSGSQPWRIGAPAAGVVHAHNAYCYRCPFGLTYPTCDVRCAGDVEELIRTTTTGQVAAFIAEPIQGVGGFITPPKEYFPMVAAIVRRHGGLFISDEVQTAWGRTGGKWFGIEHSGVTPDILTSAKGLGNGTPIAVTVARDEVAAALKGLTISTFGGNPVAATAAKAVLDYIDEHDLRTNAAETGAYLRAKLEELKERHPVIGDVRGMGLMQALELVKDRATKEPAPEATAALMEAARRERLLIGKGGLYGNCIRISPPLNIGRTDVDEFARRLDAALSAAAL
ncbi:MAG TPA: aspartate aminotransferase family protein [Solibacterales bacterium]|nr:aspartate aminotransferase family protein [Bryobacterales bacterium]